MNNLMLLRAQCAKSGAKVVIFRQLAKNRDRFFDFMLNGASESGVASLLLKKFYGKKPRNLGIFA